MTVGDLMSKNLVDCRPEMSLVDAAAEMRAHCVSALAVLEGGAIAGVITERDMLRAIVDRRRPDATRVSEYMTRSPLTIEESAPAAQAAQVMIRHQVRHLPVTDHGRLAGFLSARDLLALKPWPKQPPVGESW